MASSVFDALAAEYKQIACGEGAQVAASVANALTTAERLESDRHWGAFSKDEAFKRRTRLLAWKQVAARRAALDKLVHQDLLGIVQRMRKCGVSSELVEVYEKDIVLKSGISVSISRGTLGQEEVYALLAVWAASPIRG